jgi:hypothetical protein
MTKTVLWLVAAALPVAATAQIPPQTVLPTDTTSITKASDTSNSLSTDTPANTAATPTNAIASDSMTDTTTSDQSAKRRKSSRKNKIPFIAKK